LRGARAVAAARGRRERPALHRRGGDPCADPDAGADRDWSGRFTTHTI